MNEDNVRRQPVRLRALVALCGVGALAASFFGGRALAAGIPDADALRYAGTLLAVDGTPVEGSHDIEIEFSATTTGEPLCSTSAPGAEVTLGRFSVELEDTCADVVADNPNLYVQVHVDGEAFGWSKVGAVPYAIEAGRAGAASGELDDRIAEAEARLVPSGAVMAFASSACPAGWSILAAAQGRTIVGLPSGGALEGTVGSALANLEDRAHSHEVDPVSFASSAAGQHFHSVDPASTWSGYTDVNHSHDVDPPATTLPAHRHAWASFNTTTLNWSTYGSAGSTLSLVTWSNGVGDDGSGNYPLEHSPANSGTNTYYTGTQIGADGGAAGSLDIAAFASGSSKTSLSHTHSVDIASTNSSATGEHSHDVDVAATTSTTVGTSAVMPYLQLLYCRKD